MPPGLSAPAPAATPSLPDGTAGFSGRGRRDTPVVGLHRPHRTCPLPLLILPRQSSSGRCK